MENQVLQIAERIRGLRLIMEFTPEDMAEAADVTVEEYLACEEGKNDFSFTFLYKCAEKFGVDIAEIVTGDVPKHSCYSLTRKGRGVPIKRRRGFFYQHLGSLLKNRKAEPFIVCAPFSENEQNEPIHLSTHAGQEFDYVLKGKLKVEIAGHIEIMNEGDSIFYDSGKPHGMIATGGADCEFLAMVLKEEKEHEFGM